MLIRGLAQLLIFVGTITVEAAPRFAVFEAACPEQSRRVDTTDDEYQVLG
jgi:hypothetical protein